MKRILRASAATVYLLGVSACLFRPGDGYKCSGDGDCAPLGQDYRCANNTCSRDGISDGGAPASSSTSLPASSSLGSSLAPPSSSAAASSSSLSPSSSRPPSSTSTATSAATSSSPSSSSSAGVCTRRCSGAGCATQIAAGDQFNCALDTNQHVNCWGTNVQGALGNNSTVSLKALPGSTVQGPGGQLSNVTHIAAGPDHACAVADQGKVYCWGDNTSRELGATDAGAYATVAIFSGVTGAVSVSAGYRHTCARFGDGGVQCWGNVDNGRLGPDPLDLGGPATDVLAGQDFSLFLVNQTLLGVGNNAGSGMQLGLGGGPPPMTVTTPTAVGGLPGGIRQASQLDTHGCAVTTGDQLYCWGSNSHGELNITDNSFSGYAASPVEQGGAWESVTTGGHFTCAITKPDHNVMCWGYSTRGQAGADGFDEAAPNIIDGTRSAVQLTAGDNHVCLLDSCADVYCWGDNRYGQVPALGIGTLRTTQAQHIPLR